jgi:signal transduction histidine kinase
LHRAVEAERAAIAREIHDDVGGMLTALRFDLTWLARHSNEETLLARARQGLETLDQAVLAVQRVMRNLRPPALDAGIVAALDFLAQQTGRRTGMEVTLHSNRDAIDLPEPLAITVYRVAQEALTNVAKHAQATRAHLDLLVRDDTLSLEVSDNGIGIRKDDIKKPDSFGLRGLSERVRQVRGWLDISTSGGRATLIATIPLTEQAAAQLEEGPEA